MKFSILALVLLVALPSFAAPSITVQSRNAVKLNQVNFIYEPFEDGASLRCSHEATSAENPFDLNVKCTSTNGIAKKYTVHLILNRYRHPTPPKVSYELMYWVNGNGATTWYHFDEATNLVKLESSQSITGENAGLKLTLLLE